MTTSTIRANATATSSGLQLVPNTHNSPTRRVYKKGRTILCFNSRPCYEAWHCDYCYGLYRAFMRVQMQFLAPSWKLEHFHTATIQEPYDDPKLDLALAASYRSQLARYTRGCGKTITAIALGRNTLVPHLHMMASGSLPELKLDEASNKCRREYGFLNIRLHSKPIRQGTEHELLDYLIHKNLRPTVPYRPSRLRLLTASRGLRCGRPCALPHVPNWNWNNRKGGVEC